MLRFAFLLIACLASLATAQVYTRELPCANFDSCLCDAMPRAIAAAKGKKASATLYNPATQQNVVIDLSRPLSGELRAYCARVASNARAAAKVPKRQGSAPLAYW
uniref:Uncharacterized protein n=1 Tax=Anopheles albimanus TaxID=7167 RepID=A0A182F7P5_ANOAL